MPDVSEAYSQGYIACRTGKVVLSENPYVERSILKYQEWRRGWLHAEADIDAENETRQFREPKAGPRPGVACDNCGFTAMHSDSCSVGQRRA